jgi:raffinose/stachyose/melibiose transport system substrate-binding protein
MSQECTNDVGGRSRWRTASAALGASAVLLVAACSPPGSAPERDNDQPADISTEVPTDEEIELVMAHYEDGGLGESIERLIAAYEQMHPNITITPRFTSFEDYGRSIRLTMSADAPPDIAQAGQGYVMMGPLVEAGLLLPLDAYAEAYGWDERIPEGLLAQSRFQADARSFGDGNLYGLALGGNMVGVFYNRRLAEQLDLDLPPATLADFEQALAAAREAGITPISLGNLEGWPANHILSSLMSRHQAGSEMLDWIYGREGATFDTPSTRDALAVLDRWVDERFIPESSNGTADPAAIGSFIDGESLFLFTGNWSAATIDEGMGEDAGFMLLPPLRAGDPQRATGATTAPFGVHAGSEYPDVAANFIDFMTSDEAAGVLLEGGYAPLVPEALESGAEVSGTRAAFNDAFAEVLADDGLTLYLDWATVTMNDALFPVLQQLIGGDAIPDDVIQTVQSDWETARGSS